MPPDVPKSLGREKVFRVNKPLGLGAVVYKPLPKDHVLFRRPLLHAVLLAAQARPCSHENRVFTLDY